jgi:hypothetical protein
MTDRWLTRAAWGLILFALLYFAFHVVAHVI